MSSGDEMVTVGPGVVVTVRNNMIVKVASCRGRAAAEDAVYEFADANPSDPPALGFEQVVGFGEWRESSPSGWLECEVKSL